jgi:hypothetical protein
LVLNFGSGALLFHYLWPKIAGSKMERNYCARKCQRSGRQKNGTERYYCSDCKKYQQKRERLLDEIAVKPADRTEPALQQGKNMGDRSAK